MRYIRLTEGPLAQHIDNARIRSELLSKVQAKWDEFIECNQSLHDEIADIPNALFRRLTVLALFVMLCAIALCIGWFLFLSAHSQWRCLSLCAMMGIAAVDGVASLSLALYTRRKHRKLKVQWLEALKAELTEFVDGTLSVDFSNVDPRYLLSVRERKYKLSLCAAAQGRAH